MNDLRLPSDSYTSDCLEGALRTFFRAEMPDPWPVLRAPELPREPLARPWWKRSGRLALAASVVLMLIGYLAVARSFPRSDGVRQNVLEPASGTIGQKPSLRMPVLIEERKEGDGWSFKVYTGNTKEKR